jgi:hypothetical protein
MLNGSCLCGDVAYEVDSDPGPIVHCHCATCRKTHGSAFSTVTNVPRDRFRWIKGESLLRGFESSPGKTRYFCSQCGSHIIAARAKAKAPSCCEWAASTRRLPSGPKCTSGDRMLPRGSTRRTSCPNGRKVPRRRCSECAALIRPSRFPHRRQHDIGRAGARRLVAGRHDLIDSGKGLELFSPQR